jgi:hypothetical protein
MKERDLDPRDIYYKKKMKRQVLHYTDSDMFPSVIFGTPAYSYDREEIFVEFDTSEDKDYLGKAFIRWSAIHWLDKNDNLKMCAFCDAVKDCWECNACEFDLSPFEFKGPCRFQDRESRYVCEDCRDVMDELVEKAIEENPSSFVAREI